MSIMAVVAEWAGFEAEHQLGDAPNEPVILFEDIVEVLLLPDGNQWANALGRKDHSDRLKPFKVGAAHWRRSRARNL
jgi:hypothetical protein